MAAFDESKNCDNLYFKKGVYYWTEYMIDGIEASCKYSQPPDTEWTGSQTVWNQKTEKLARNSLMFADGVSVTSPAQGVQVKYLGGSTYAALWETTEHRVALPWRIDTGFNTGDTGFLFFKFGEPDRTALIWGVRFMREQIHLLGGITFKIAYNYHKDVERGAYGSGVMRNPSENSDSTLDISITAADLDDNGLYFFKDPSNNQKPLKIVASHIYLDLSAGYINLDFVGTFYDFGVASTGKQGDNRDDNWRTRKIGNFWVSGECEYVE